MTDREIIEAIYGFAASMNNCATSRRLIVIEDCGDFATISEQDQQKYEALLKAEITFRKIVDLCLRSIGQESGKEPL